MFINTLSQVLLILNTALGAAVMAGTIAAFRYGHARGDAEQFATTLTALQAEITALKDQVARLEASNKRLRVTIGAMRVVLRRRGIEFMIEPDTITFTDVSGSQTLTNLRPHRPEEDEEMIDGDL
jgi:hypothetical protein